MAREDMICFLFATSFLVDRTPRTMTSSQWETSGDHLGNS